MRRRGGDTGKVLERAGRELHDESLKQRGVPVEYVLFPDEGHGFSKTPNRTRETTAVVRWFVEHLKAAEE